MEVHVKVGWGGVKGRVGKVEGKGTACVLRGKGG